MSVVVCAIILLVVVTLNSFNPVNSDSFVFASTNNVFLKTMSSQGNYYYQVTKGGKSFSSGDGTSHSIKASKGNLIQIHLINEDRNLPNNPSKHNLNIDEFNVHIKDLDYFQSESVTFFADKTGTFDYYCSIHPGMKDTITVSE